MGTLSMAVTTSDAGRKPEWEHCGNEEIRSTKSPGGPSSWEGNTEAAKKLDQQKHEDFIRNDLQPGEAVAPGETSAAAGLHNGEVNPGDVTNPSAVPFTPAPEMRAEKSARSESTHSKDHKDETGGQVNASSAGLDKSGSDVAAEVEWDRESLGDSDHDSELEELSDDSSESEQPPEPELGSASVRDTASKHGAAAPESGDEASQCASAATRIVLPSSPLLMSTEGANDTILAGTVRNLAEAPSDRPSSALPAETSTAEIEAQTGASLASLGFPPDICAAASTSAVKWLVLGIQSARARDATLSQSSASPAVSKVTSAAPSPLEASVKEFRDASTLGVRKRGSRERAWETGRRWRESGIPNPGQTSRAESAGSATAQLRQVMQQAVAPRAASEDGCALGERKEVYEAWATVFPHVRRRTPRHQRGAYIKRIPEHLLLDGAVRFPKPCRPSEKPSRGGRARGPTGSRSRARGESRALQAAAMWPRLGSPRARGWDVRGSCTLQPDLVERSPDCVQVQTWTRISEDTVGLSNLEEHERVRTNTMPATPAKRLGSVSGLDHIPSGPGAKRVRRGNNPIVADEAAAPTAANVLLRNMPPPPLHMQAEWSAHSVPHRSEAVLLSIQALPHASAGRTACLLSPSPQMTPRGLPLPQHTTPLDDTILERSRATPQDGRRSALRAEPHAGSKKQDGYKPTTREPAEPVQISISVQDPDPPASTTPTLDPKSALRFLPSKVANLTDSVSRRWDTASARLPFDEWTHSQPDDEARIFSLIFVDRMQRSGILAAAPAGPEQMLQRVVQRTDGRLARFSYDAARSPPDEPRGFGLETNEDGGNVLKQRAMHGSHRSVGRADKQVAEQASLHMRRMGQGGGDELDGSGEGEDAEPVEVRRSGDEGEVEDGSGEGEDAEPVEVRGSGDEGEEEDGIGKEEEENDDDDDLNEDRGGDEDEEEEDEDDAMEDDEDLEDAASQDSDLGELVIEELSDNPDAT